MISFSALVEAKEYIPFKGSVTLTGMPLLCLISNLALKWLQRYPFNIALTQ